MKLTELKKTEFPREKMEKYGAKRLRACLQLITVKIRVFNIYLWH